MPMTDAENARCDGLIRTIAGQIETIHFNSMLKRLHDVTDPAKASNLDFCGLPYDPESLLTGLEAAEGLTYGNSKRAWPDKQTWLDAVAGNLTIDEIAAIAPRRYTQDAEPTALDSNYPVEEDDYDV